MYIVLEGINGAGKDTQLDLLVEHFQRQGQNPLRINEPNRDLPPGALLHQLLLTGEHRAAWPALFVADRLAQMAALIEPALAEGRPVVASRCFLSTLAYQGQGGDMTQILDLHATLPRRITHLILLDLEPTTGLERVAARSPERDVHETLHQMAELREAYLSLIGTHAKQVLNMLAPGARLFLISARPPALQVHQHIVEALSR